MIGFGKCGIKCGHYDHRSGKLYYTVDADKSHKHRGEKGGYCGGSEVTEKMKGGKYKQGVGECSGYCRDAGADGSRKSAPGSILLLSEFTWAECKDQRRDNADDDAGQDGDQRVLEGDVCRVGVEKCLYNAGNAPYSAKQCAVFPAEKQSTENDRYMQRGDGCPTRQIGDVPGVRYCRQDNDDSDEDEDTEEVEEVLSDLDFEDFNSFIEDEKEKDDDLNGAWTFT